MEWAGTISLAHGEEGPGAGLKPTRLPDRTIRWMLSWAVSTWLLIGGGQALAQGTVNFANRVSGTLVCYVYGPQPCQPGYSLYGNGTGDTPPGTTDWIGFTKLSGSNYLAQLRAAPGADASESALRWATSAPTSFRTGTGAGVLVATTGILDGVAKDATVATLQLFVWDNTSGLYPDAVSGFNAAKAGLVVYGYSTKFNLNAIGGDFNVPPNLTGLRSFNIYSLSAFPAIPHITLQPSNRTVDAGSDATFYVGAVYYPTYAGGPMTPYTGPFQWYFGGAPLSGGINGSLTITNAQAKDAGGYSVLLTGPCGSVMSATAQLTVTLRVHDIGGTLNPDGFHLTILSDPGLVCHVDTSTNLVDWTTLTWVTNTLGSTTIIDPWPPARDRRFYRAVP